jgi:hypothetical protein
MTMIRNAVVREIRRRKKSGYEFAHSLKGTHPQTIMKWIYSGRCVSLATVEKVLAALDLVVVPKSSKITGSA